MENLELRYYSRQELAEILGIDSKSKHFARDVKTTLDKWGYKYDKYSCKGLRIIEKPEGAEARLNEIFNRALNIDIRTEIYAMACFLMMIGCYEEFQSMPWATRSEELYKEFGVRVDERTLRNWANKLIRRELIFKSGYDKTAWISYKINGETYREMITGNDDLEADMRKYYKKRTEYRNEYRQREILENNRDDYEKINSESWSYAMCKLWEEFHCCYYYCGSYYLNALGEYALEIYELVEEISEKRKQEVL